MNVHNTSFGSGCRIGIDVGGTFTDFVLFNGRTGALVRYKEPSVPEDPSRSVELGLAALIERAGVKASEIELIVHGTTLPLNAIIQRRGARLGLLVSRGNRGILEIGRAQLPNAFSINLDKETPLVPRRLVLETSARLNHDGTVHEEATDAELAAAAQAFSAAGVNAVTVLLLHSYANPTFEQDIADRLAEKLQGVRVSAAAGIWPERREFERSLIALINSYVQPIMDSYLDRLQRRVSALGIDGPIYITANNGGTLSLNTARRRPIDSILSGPASGVVAAAISTKPTGRRNFVTVDMGGTSADMSIIQNGEPENTTRTHVGDFPLMMPVVNVSAIGAGGGSIIWVDAQGVLKVGPQSAGASPGPVCYGRGGTEPTVTDCYLLAGFIDGDYFLGGRMKLDVDAARRALEGIADRIGLSGEDRAMRAAEAALRVTTAVMATEMSKNIAQRGEEIVDYALVPFGGAGPTQANLLAQDCGIKQVIIPAAPSTFCALGAILADVKRDYVRSHYLTLAADRSVAEIRDMFDALEAEAADWIASEGSILSESSFEHVIDMRYGGQAYDLPVALDAALRADLDLSSLIEAFHRVHERNYSFRDNDTHVEVTALRLRVVGKVPQITLPVAAKIAKPSVGHGATRQFFWNGAYHQAALYMRADLPAGSAIDGPAIVEQEDTTSVILAGWHARVDANGNLIVEVADG